MISYHDCIAMCGLTEDEVRAIAEHEHVPEIVAASLAQYLLNQRHGCEAIRDIIVADVREAQGLGDRAKVQNLLHVLHHFLRDHPEAHGVRGQ